MVVFSSANAVLTGERLNWTLDQGLIETESPFTLITDKSRLKGANSSFSLAEGGIKKIAPAPKPVDAENTQVPGLAQGPLNLTTNFLGKNSSSSGHPLLSWYLLAMMQNQAPAGVGQGPGPFLDWSSQMLQAAPPQQ